MKMMYSVVLSFVGLFSCVTLIIVFSPNLFHITGQSFLRTKRTSEEENEESFQIKKESDVVVEDDEKCLFGFDFFQNEPDDNKLTEKHLLPANRNQNFSGALFNRDFICLDTMDGKSGQWVGFYECHGEGRNQMITFTRDGLIATESNLCLAIKNLISEEVILKKCNPLDEKQIWSIQSYRGWLMPVVKAHFCLTAPDKEFDPVTVSVCKIRSDHRQRWRHTLQEVLALLISGNFHQRFFSSHKFKKSRAKVKQVLLHHSNDDNAMLFG